MKEYKIGDLMTVPFEGQSIETEILHIPQHPSEMWIFKHPMSHEKTSPYYQKAFGIHTGSLIIKVNTNGN